MNSLDLTDKFFFHFYTADLAGADIGLAMFLLELLFVREGTLSLSGMFLSYKDLTKGFEAMSMF